MEKVADDYFRFTERRYASEGVRVNMIIDLIDGEYLDTSVNLDGNFCIIGSKRHEFVKKLGELIEEYRI